MSCFIAFKKLTVHNKLKIRTNQTANAWNVHGSSIYILHIPYDKTFYYAILFFPNIIKLKK